MAFIEVTLLDPKAPKEAPPKRRYLNPRYIVDFISLAPEVSDEQQPLVLGTEVKMHNGKTHLISETTTTLRQMLGRAS